MKNSLLLSKSHFVTFTLVIKAVILSFIAILLFNTSLWADGLSSARYRAMPDAVKKVIAERRLPRPQASVSYSSPVTFYVGQSSSLLPTASGADPYAFSTPATTLPSGASEPRSICVDAQGQNQYVTDWAAGTVVKRGLLSNNPTTYATGLSIPEGIVMDPSGNLFICDTGNGAIKEVVNGSSATTTLWSGLTSPYGIALDAANNIYYTDNTNGKVYKLPFLNIPGNIYGSPVLIASGFTSPQSIAVDGEGDIYVGLANTGGVKEILSTQNGGGTITVLSGTGNQLTDNVYQMAIDNTGDLFVLDTSDGDVKEVIPGSTTPATIASGFNFPTGLAIDYVGNFYITDYNAHTEKEFSQTGGYFMSPQLPAGLFINHNTGEIFGSPWNTAAAKNYLVTARSASGSASATVNIGVKIPPPTVSYASPQRYVTGNTITPLAPTTSNVASATFIKVPPITSAYALPYAVAADNKGYIYFVQQSSSNVYKMSLVTNTVSVIGTATQPIGLAVDTAGDVFVADQVQTSIMEILANGQGTVFKGTGFNPDGVAVDAAGDLYIADTGNDEVKEILAGTNNVIVLESNIDATNVAVDQNGYVYATDATNGVVKKIAPGGASVVTLVSGYTGIYGLALDGDGDLFFSVRGSTNAIYELLPGASGASSITTGLNFPLGVGVDGNGDVFIADYNNSEIQKLAPQGGFYIAPFLPAGLAFDCIQGKLSGTPSQTRLPQNYIITAWNSTASASATLNMGVTPITFSYATPQVYTVTKAIIPLSPTGSGVSTVASYSSSAPVVANNLNDVTAVAADGAGNIYIGDTNNNLVKKMPAGGGTPVAVGTGFNTPTGLAFDLAGNLYISDNGTNSIKKINAGSTTVSTIASTGFAQPYGLAVDRAGNIYIADYGSNTVKKLAAGGSVPTTYATGFNGPLGVALDGSGNLFVTDANNARIMEVPAGGGTPVQVYADASLIVFPFGITVDAAGDIILGDRAKNAIYMINPAHTSISTLNSGTINAAGVALDPYGNIFIADQVHGKVEEINPTGGYYVNTLLPAGLAFTPGTGAITGTPTTATPATNYSITGYNGVYSNSATINITVNNSLPAPTISYASPQTYIVNKPITTLTPTSTNVTSPLAYGSSISNFAINLGSPIATATDAAGNVYIAERSKTTITKIPAGGGSPTYIGSGFSLPTGIAVDAAGNVYVADLGNKAIKMIPTGGGAPVTLGSGFISPFGVSVDAAGNVYVGDQNYATVRVITAGNGPIYTLGSSFSIPCGVAVDAAGNVYVADEGNNAIKMIPAGNGTPVVVGSDFNQPYDVKLDGAGNIYVADYGNNAVKMIPAGGTTPVAVGTGYIHPTGIAISSGGILYTANFSNATVTQTTPVAGYFISLPLPHGLGFNTSTGAVSGTPALANPATNYTVTGYNAGGPGSGIVNIKVITSTSANDTLSKLTASVGTLSPAFSPAKTSYTITVSSLHPTINFTPTAANTGATITVDGIATTSGMASDTIKLKTGANTVTIQVTAPNGVAKQSYTIVVTRQPSTNAGLAKLLLSSGTLTPTFATATTSYTASVSNSVSSVTMTPTASDITSTIKVNGTAVASGTASTPVSLSVGSNTITTVITAQDGTTTKTYTVTVTRQANVSLSGLTVSIGTLSPAFSASKTSYAVVLSNLHPTIAITPTVSDPTEAITVNGATVTSGTASAAIKLVVGTNNIAVVVTAADHVTKQTYTIVVTRQPSTVATLSHLILSSGTLTPTFAAATTDYTATVDNSISTIKLTPTSSDTTATIKVNGTIVKSGVASASIALAVGTNTINTVVTAGDGSTTKTYTVVITRSQNASLANLTVSIGNLSPAFSAAKTSYTVVLSNLHPTITVTPTVADPAATVKVDGNAITSGSPSAAIQLPVGTTTIPVQVTASNGVTKETYTIAVTRQPSTNAGLAKLLLSSGTLTPVFATATTSYTATVDNTITTIKLTPTSSDTTATIKVNGTGVKSGAASASISLAVGANTINAVVIAGDGTTTKTYTVTVTRSTAGPVMEIKDPVTQSALAVPFNSLTGLADEPFIHRAVSPNGDGIDDHLQIDGITLYPDNKLVIVSASGNKVFECKGYDNVTRVFDGHSSTNGAMSQPGTYFYMLQYKVAGETKSKTGYLILKY